jgi:GT2 family glycosyltransferase
MPIRDEEHSIGRSLGSVLGQTYPPDRYEVIIADGMSTDRTRGIIDAVVEDRRRAGSTPRVEVIDNPERIVPTALNRAIARARGDLVVCVGGHSELAPDYLAACVRVVEETGAEVVGGVVRAEGEGRQGVAIATALGSQFGVGSAAWHYAVRSRWADTVPYACLRRSVFDRIGGFDEELVRNQDDELNFRVVQSGGRIRLDPSVRATYFCRSTLRALWRQYFEYGVFKVRVIQKRGRPASWRHLAPPALTALVGSALVAAAASRRPRPVAVVVVPYAVACLVAGAIAARRTDATATRVGLAFATMHLSYGIGFHVGLWRWRHEFSKWLGGE